jgi:hypothetical protein
MRKTLISLLLISGTFCFADTLTTRDGAQHQGTVQSATSTYVLFKEGTKVNRYSRTNIQSIEFSAHLSSAAYSSNDRRSSNSAGRYNRVTVPAGTDITVMTNDNIDSNSASEGQTFSADVAENVTGSNGQVVIPKGSEADLVIRRVASQGKVTGNSELVLDLQSVRVNGRRYTISTEDVSQENHEGLGANKRTAEMVGGGAVLGTLIGAVAGGGKGAAIGAVTGSAAGAGAQVLTRGKSVKVPAESKLSFKLDQPLSLQAAY